MSDLEAPADAPSATDLTSLLAGKLCHDFISPSGAIVAGLDLMNDPSSADMRDDALVLIEQSARKMVATVHFARLAFGSAGAGEEFGVGDVEALVRGVTEGGRGTMTWSGEGRFSRAEARILANLAYVGAGALALGGEARLSVSPAADMLTFRVESEGPRARLKPEALTGLAGQRLMDGLPGQWIQPYWLSRLVAEAGGRLTVDVATEGRVLIEAVLPG